MTWVWVVAVILAAALAFACISVIRRHEATKEDWKYVITALTSMLGVVLGYAAQEARVQVKTREVERLTVSLGETSERAGQLASQLARSVELIRRGRWASQEEASEAARQLDGTRQRLQEMAAAHGPASQAKSN